MINRNEIITGFKEFRNEPIDPAVKAYGDDHSQLIGQIFMLVKKSSKVIANQDGSKNRLEFVFPIAKVLQVGKRWQGTGWDQKTDTISLKPGDLVRLRDNDCKTSLNPAWEAYNRVVNDVKDGNLTPIGEAPPMYMCQMRESFGRRVFNPDPFNLSGHIESWGWDIFFFDEAHVTMPVEDPDLLINLYAKSIINLNQN